MAKEAKEVRQKAFTNKDEAVAEALHMNGQRKVNKDGKLVGNYRTYTCKLQDSTVFVVAKSPLSAQGYAAINFGVVVETDRKTPVKKVNPKTYLSYLTEDERKEWEDELARRKNAA